MEDIDLHAITVLSYEWGCAYAATWNQSNYELVEGCTIYSICQFAWGNTSFFLMLLTAKNHIHTISIWYGYFLKVDFMVSVNVQFRSSRKCLLKILASVTPSLLNIFLFCFFFSGKLSRISIINEQPLPQPPSAPFYFYLFEFYLFFRHEQRLTHRVS